MGMTPIDTIREILRCQHEYAKNAHWAPDVIGGIQEAQAALTALETELATLRQNALDWKRTPDGWEFGEMCLYTNDFEVTLFKKGVPDPHDYDHPEWRVCGSGSTPAAAFNAACERARKA